MSKRIQLSFKETDKDMKLFLVINEQNDKSAFIKEAIRFYLDHKHDYYEKRKEL